LAGLKLAAAIGTPRTVNVANQRPPSRRKNEPGLNSAHEYKIESFKDEYSFTCQTHKNLRADYLIVTYIHVISFSVQLLECSAFCAAINKESGLRSVEDIFKMCMHLSKAK